MCANPQKDRRIQFRVKVYQSGKYLHVLERDNYKCRYCKKKVIPHIELYKKIEQEQQIFYDQYLTKEISYKKYLKLSDTRLLYNKYKKIYQKKLATIDHIIPIRNSGSDDEVNLATACLSCNAKKGAR